MSGNPIFVYHLFLKFLIEFAKKLIIPRATEKMFHNFHIEYLLDTF